MKNCEACKETVEMVHNKKKEKWKKLTEFVPEETKTLDLIDKDFRLAVSNTFKEVKETTDKELRKPTEQFFSK